VSEGRKGEFKEFPGFSGEVPDPQDPASFGRSRLDWAEPERPGHAHTLALYRALLDLRKQLDGPADALPVGETALHVRRGRHHLLVAFSPASFPRPEGTEVVLHTEDDAYATDPQPLEIGAERVLFHRAGAVVLREGVGTVG